MQRKPIEIDMAGCGVSPDVCQIPFQERGFLTPHFFTEWAEAVFFPDTIQTRRTLRYAAPIFLILDRFAGHPSDAVDEQCLFYGVVLLVVPPQTFDQVHALDLGFSLSPNWSANAFALTPT
jgi:hypothetical protein